MKFTASRPSDLFTMDARIRSDIKKFLTIRVSVALEQFQQSIMRTPVYTGRTLANFRWSLGEPITTTRGPIKNPELPGKTSVLSIGEEPRRAANAALVETEFRQVLAGYAANPFQKVFLTNNVPNFTDVEYGTYGKDARTPAGGMTRRGEAQLKMIIRGVTKSE
jgi:hypothetical protein